MFSRKTRTFTYSIPQLSIKHKEIKVKLRKYKRINDLKEKIASYHDISKEDLVFQNAPNEKLKKIDNNFNFKLIFLRSNPVIHIKTPNGKIILIEDSFIKSFNDIFPFLEDENLYYTPFLIDNYMKLYLGYDEIDLEDFPVLWAYKNSFFELKLTIRPIVLQYGPHFFYAADNEYSSEIIKLVQKKYQNLNIVIEDSQGNKPEKLKSGEKYKT